jgi:hypothetical protein
MLELRSRTEFVLNVLIYNDFSCWSQPDLRELIDKLAETVGGLPTQQNRILLTYNPILTICLMCCHFNSIGKAISIFKHEVNDNVNELLSLGEVIISNY